MLIISLSESWMRRSKYLSGLEVIIVAMRLPGNQRRLQEVTAVIFTLLYRFNEQDMKMLISEF